jgi:hypothetical protein
MRYKNIKRIGDIFLILFLNVFLMISISAVPLVTTTQQFVNGYNIQIPQDNILKVGQDYIFEFHVFNISNGVPIINGISCDLHLYDNLGGQTYYGTDSSTDTYGDYTFNISGRNFSKVDNYYYFVRCNSSTMGGFAESILNITPTGNTNDFNLGFILVNIFFLILWIVMIFLSSKLIKRK